MIETVKLKNALHSVIDVLDSASVDHAVSGGLAVAFHELPRATNAEPEIVDPRPDVGHSEIRRRLKISKDQCCVAREIGKIKQLAGHHKDLADLEVLGIPLTNDRATGSE